MNEKQQAARLRERAWILLVCGVTMLFLAGAKAWMFITGGLGVMAKSLIEYPLAGQFSRFTAQVGIDAATEGRGSVVFEVYADGKRIWTSGLMSGLDQPKKVDLSVASVQRLRLVVTDGGDGNKFDAADWCEPVLHRD